MELFVSLVNDFMSLTKVIKNSISDVARVLDKLKFRESKILDRHFAYTLYQRDFLWSKMLKEHLRRKFDLTLLFYRIYCSFVKTFFLVNRKRS